MGFDLKGTFISRFLIAALMVACAPLVTAQLIQEDNQDSCLYNDQGIPELGADCGQFNGNNNGNGNSTPSRYSTSTSDLYLEWAWGSTPPSGCLSDSVEYDHLLGNLYLCGQWWDDSEIEIEYYSWSTTTTPPQTGHPMLIAGWTGIWESELKYLHIVWSAGTDPWGGDPSSSSGLPD